MISEKKKVRLRPELDGPSNNQVAPINRAPFVTSGHDRFRCSLPCQSHRCLQRDVPALPRRRRRRPTPSKGGCPAAAAQRGGETAGAAPPGPTTTPWPSCLWGYGSRYSQDKTWAAPSEVAQPIRSRRARRCSVCTARYCIVPNRRLSFNPAPLEYIRRGRGPLVDTIHTSQYNTPKTQDIGITSY